MINFITRYFTSLWAFITSPFRAVWRVIVRIFPPREFTVMDTPRGNVYTYGQSSFWRFARFCGAVGLVVWAAWSTYVFVYHRPLLQKRTEQLEEARATHTRHMSDLQTYLTKYNDLVRDLNVIDDKVWEGVQAILNSRTKHRVSNNSGKETYLLTGKIICGECGHSFTGVRHFSGRNKLKYVCYHCSNRKRTMSHACRNKEIRRSYYGKDNDN